MSENLPKPACELRLFCNRCKTDTNHINRGQHKRSYTEVFPDGGSSWEEVTYRLWTCAGCDTGSLEKAWTASGYTDENGERMYDSEFFPPRGEHLLAERVFHQLPPELTQIYRETIQAFNHQLYVLCAAGLRALIEGICEHKDIRGANLEKRIDGLEAVLPKNIVVHLHKFRFIGNDALHSLTAPEAKSLRLAIDVTDDLLNFLYDLDYKASQLHGKQNPPRPA